ncbi:MAG TPA: hypothetical protein VFR41_04085 [Acidimicrobiia bacterium]|nr:hypothetical protein [Acidimicrobiia bacterium]
MDSILAPLEHTLASQRGLVTLDQLRSAAVSHDKVRSLVARKVVRRVRPRVFALVGVEDSWERGLQAVVLSAEDASASHSAGASLWSFSHRPDRYFEITVDRNRRPELDGVLIHRSRTLDATDIKVVAGIKCTSFERTLCDCTTLLSPFQLSRVLDDGLRRGIASIARLADCAERVESARGRHMSVIRWLLSQRDEAFDPGGSASELRVLRALRAGGVIEPVQQHVVRIRGRRFVLDYAWPKKRVFCEYYGLKVHSGASAVAYDSERITLLAAAGWTPVIVTDGTSDEQIVANARAALETRVGTEISA